MREVEPKTPEETARQRAAEDAAWAVFLGTPAWSQIRRTFEEQRRRYIRQIAQLGLSDGDRAVMAGALWVLEQFLSTPEKALQRLTMYEPRTTPDAPETSMRDAGA